MAFLCLRILEKKLGRANNPFKKNVCLSVCLIVFESADARGSRGRIMDRESFLYRSTIFLTGHKEISLPPPLTACPRTQKRREEVERTENSLAHCIAIATKLSWVLSFPRDYYPFLTWQTDFATARHCILRLFSKLKITKQKPMK